MSVFNNFSLPCAGQVVWGAQLSQNARSLGAHTPGRSGVQGAAKPPGKFHVCLPIGLWFQILNKSLSFVSLSRNVLN